MNITPPAPTMMDLRRLLQAKFPEAHASAVKAEARWETQLPCLDAAGLALGAITEVVGETKSCGTGLLIASLLENPGQIQQPVALVDGCDAFDPATVAAAARDRLLWLRCTGVTSATRAADLLLRDGNIPLVLLDLQLCPAKQLLGQPSSIWHRLRFLAEKSGTALCIFTPCRVIACARSRVILEPCLDLPEMERPRAELVQGLQAQVERGGHGAGMGTAMRHGHVALAN